MATSQKPTSKSSRAGTSSKSKVLSLRRRHDAPNYRAGLGFVFVESEYYFLGFGIQRIDTVSSDQGGRVAAGGASRLLGHHSWNLHGDAPFQWQRLIPGKCTCQRVCGCSNPVRFCFCTPLSSHVLLLISQAVFAIVNIALSSGIAVVIQ